MDQLPKLKDFRAIEAEPEPPDPLWRRFAGYLTISFLCGCVLGGFELYESLGLSVKRQPHQVRYAKPEEKIEIVKNRATLWFAAGFAIPLIFFTVKEINRRNED